MREGLTDTTRKALAAAQTAARERRQDYVGAEHLMLGILATEGDAARILKSVHVNPREVARTLVTCLPTAATEPEVTGDLPLTPTAQKVINGSIVKAQSMREPHVSTRFLLLSLLDELPAAVRKALTETGGDLDEITTKLIPRPALMEP